MKTRLYVQLGRAGDIINILPVLLRDFERTGVRPGILVAEAYAALLEGVGYVCPYVFPGDFRDTLAAIQLAEKIAAADDLTVVVTQIYGKDLWAVETCSSFVRESWARVPDAPAWGSLPLVFDRRDPEREAGVISHLVRDPSKPYIVVALDGVSSPFEHASLVRETLRHQIRGVQIVEVSAFLAHRFFDMLGLLEGAQALVAIDTGILHLAHAVPGLPVVAFITRNPSRWHGTAWRPMHFGRFYYDEVPDRIAEIAAAVGRTTWVREELMRPTIVHAYSHFEEGPIDPETVRRMEFARRTWVAEYQQTPWAVCEFKREDSRRSSGDAPINDPRPIPFWKDIIEKAIVGRAPWDVIALTNADVCFTPGLSGWVLDTLAHHGCAFTHRWDFYFPMTVPLANEEQVKRGKWYSGSDAFFFTVGWWAQHGREYPDMLIGREQNDEVLRQLIKRHGGLELHGAIYHEKHPSYWEHHGNREQNPGNLYNKRLAAGWFLRNGYGPNDPEWWQIPGR